MKTTKPTTLKLALIAAQLGPRAGEERKTITQAMTLWAEAERELEQFDERAKYLKNLIERIYEATPAEWEALVTEYPGQRIDVDAALMASIPSEEVHKRLFRNKNETKRSRAALFVGLTTFARNHDLPAPRMILREASPATSDPSEPYYDAASPKYVIREVLSKPGQWPKERKFPQSGKAPTEDEINLDKKRVALELEKVRQSLSAESLTLHTVRWAVEVRQQQLAASKTRYVPRSLGERRV